MKPIILIYQDIYCYKSLRVERFKTVTAAIQWLKKNEDDICPEGEKMDYVIVDGASVIEDEVDKT